MFERRDNEMYIGLDIGTSGTKAALIREDGVVLNFHQVTYSFCNMDHGFRELDAAKVWEAVKTCLAKVGQNQNIKTITVSALGEAIIPIDKQGNALYAGITGTDARGGEELIEITEAIGKKRLIDITGLNLSVIYSANKILWLKKHEKELYEKAWKIVTFQDFIIYRLTNIAAIDYSMASRTLLFDIHTNDWSEELLNEFAIEKEKLSIPVRGGSIVGTISKHMANKLGVTSESLVVAGTHDHICNAIGSGLVNYGDCANTVGTTEGLTALLRKSQLTTNNINKYQISCEPFVVPEMYNTVAWNNTSGVLLKWFAEEFVREEPTVNIVNTFKKLNTIMKKEPTDLLVLPHFSGAATPYMDEMSKGAVLGLTLHTKREDIYKALMEGANFELALILDCLKKSGLQICKLTATGGAMSKQLLQIKADILGMTVHTVESKQTGTLGGAILGAVAVGNFKNFQEAIESMVKEGKLYEPDWHRAKIYKEKALLYKELYTKISTIHHRM